MRYPASEKLAIIRIVEQSHLPVRRTLDKLGILPGSFYRWYDKYRSGGIEALEDKSSAPSRVWNRIQMALAASGCDSARVVHKPRLLSDNGSSYVSGELADWLDGNGMDHVRGAPNHPQTQGKIERWHQTLKNRILLENYYLPGDLERALNRFVEHYNHARYHESLGNLTPADVYFGRATKILNMREKIKRDTIQKRRLTHFKTAA